MRRTTTSGDGYENDAQTGAMAFSAVHVISHDKPFVDLYILVLLSPVTYMIRALLAHDMHDVAYRS